jgi:hypothetical protein
VAFTAADTASTRVLLSPSSEPLAFSDVDKYVVWHDAMCDEIKALRVTTSKQFQSIYICLTLT